jgi:OFA family oxalate/formate antiporter-like MFS transporter
MDKGLTSIPIKEAKTGLYYGYIIAILAFCIILIIYGLRFSYGVFFTPMSSELGWSNAATSLVFSISMIMEGVFNIILGGIVDKYGPRLVVTISCILVGLGYCLIPTITSFWQFFIFYSLMVGIGMGGLFAPLVSIIARWFSARRNLITGLVISSVGIGILIVSPVANRLIISYSWKTTFLIFGVIILLVTTTCAQFLKRDPSTLGLAPDGEHIQPDTGGPIPVPGISLKEAIHSYQFWIVFLLLFSYGFCSNAVSIHIVPDALKLGISATTGATILATIGGLQIVGRIGLGLAADKVGNRIMFVLGFILFAVLTFWLPGIKTTWTLLVFAVIFGFAQGGMASSQSPITAGLFGLKSLGLLFGCVGFGFTLGAALGPYITGRVVDTFGSYQIAFLICAVISLIAFVLALFLKPLKNSPPRKIRL